MSDRYFLDTNVFVYAVRPDHSPTSRVAVQLISQALDNGIGVVSYQVVQEFFSLAFRKFPKPMSGFEAEQFLSTTFRPLLAVHSSPALFIAALQLYEQHRLSWYDAIIVAAAKEARCSILYTEDMQHGRVFDDLRIEDPFR